MDKVNVNVKTVVLVLKDRKMKTINNIHIEFPLNQDFYQLHKIIEEKIKIQAPAEYPQVNLGFKQLHKDFPEGTVKSLNYLSPQVNAELMESYIGKGHKLQIRG